MLETADISRVRAVLRRYAGQASAQWVIGSLTIEPRRYLARRGDQTLKLSPRLEPRLGLSIVGQAAARSGGGARLVQGLHGKGRGFEVRFGPGKPMY